MGNFIFLVIIFLFIAIGLVATYKFFKYKLFKMATIYLIYLILSLTLTLIYFNTRESLQVDTSELTYLLNGIKDLNIFAIIASLLILGTIVTGVLSYVKVIILESKRRGNKSKE
ncbi:MAG TPA: hypothetical protein IAB45_05635 [Candidatus Onthousia faecavium]|nr:hypothetical protein [Candidatus Onthousia faecavium]